MILSTCRAIRLALAVFATAPSALVMSACAMQSVPSGVAPAHVERSPASLGSPSTVARTNPALVNLARELAALQLVDHAASTAMHDAARRVAAMHAFIEARRLTAPFAAFARTFQPSGGQITFQQATDAALDHLASRPAPIESQDLQQVELSVQVTSAQAHQSFNQLNSLRRASEMLVTFLHQQGVLGAYQAWAAAHPGSQAARGAPLREPDQLAAAHDARALQLGWDHAQRSQSAEIAHGPYASSWWNSYADPYYDITGGADGASSANGANDASSADGAASVAGASPASDASWCTPGYSRSQWPRYAELGPNAMPAFGMFPTGSAGGATFGPASGAGAESGAR
ncbi:MAG: hypothetical protein JNK53_04360 [Phycisphaerae bacterium]|nr:hypothetical protein [Phycisphaerae bacterium]